MSQISRICVMHTYIVCNPNSKCAYAWYIQELYNLGLYRTSTVHTWNDQTLGPYLFTNLGNKMPKHTHTQTYLYNTFVQAYCLSALRISMVTGGDMGVGLAGTRLGVAGSAMITK